MPCMSIYSCLCLLSLLCTSAHCSVSFLSIPAPSFFPCSCLQSLVFVSAITSAFFSVYLGIELSLLSSLACCASYPSAFLCCVSHRVSFCVFVFLVSCVPLRFLHVISMLCMLAHCSMAAFVLPPSFAHPTCSSVSLPSYPYSHICTIVLAIYFIFFVSSLFSVCLLPLFISCMCTLLHLYLLFYYSIFILVCCTSDTLLCFFALFRQWLCYSTFFILLFSPLSPFVVCTRVSPLLPVYVVAATCERGLTLNHVLAYSSPQRNASYTRAGSIPTLPCRFSLLVFPYSFTLCIGNVIPMCIGCSISSA